MSKLTPTTIKILKALSDIADGLIVPRNSYGARKLLDYLSGNNRRYRYKLKQRLETMQQEGLIFLGGEKIRLSNKGLKLLKTMYCKEISILPTDWDGTWHIVVYDIPNTKKKARDVLRYQLISWNFHQIQESVWVLPYECKEEIALIAQEYGVAPYVLYITTTELPIAKQLIEKFQLSSF